MQPAVILPLFDVIYTVNKIYIIKIKNTFFYSYLSLSILYLHYIYNSID
jgi:hypothetical protein